ncbi:aspartyl/glutamyl-tRNA amidotransferase subunit C domain protein [Oesophagostomum dentatum]|uniref:Aspartyl/glutamyl-tRNA amidotransferase subunit C domain protein n=1 Tax=Oesophagostomum dentatum TaxID=61180 RepID=A0A0B1SQ28_OESDE|nr:aspartyl/glutamyl-tRNA amidotransferase subunit C domain protein [Oesophagostomum dentatum]
MTTNTAKHSAEMVNAKSYLIIADECIRIPVSMILELITALRSLEDEIRSKFDHIEGLVTEVSNKIGALENAIELERTTKTACSLLTNGTVPSCSWYSQSSQASDVTLDEPTSVKKEISPDINPSGDEAVDANQHGTVDEVGYWILVFPPLFPLFAFGLFA